MPAIERLQKDDSVCITSSKLILNFVKSCLPNPKIRKAKQLKEKSKIEKMDRFLQKQL